MKTQLSALFVITCILCACVHNETPQVHRTLSSTEDENASMYQAKWENDLCVLKGEAREHDFVVRFSDVHQLCPQLRDYNPAGIAYTKLKNSGRGIHVPTCTIQKNNRIPASKCWMGFDVFGQSLGSCAMIKNQHPCSSCHCDGKSGVAWK